MKLTKTTTILLVILAVVVVIASVVIYMSTSDSADGDAIVTEGEAVANVDEALFMNLASQINDIKFDGAFLNDPRFLSLVDIRVMIVPESVGRKDPFANLSGIVPTQ